MPVSTTPAVETNTGKGKPPSTATATTTSSTLLAADSNRKWCVLTNVGNKDVFLAFGQTAEVDKGAVLLGNGGSLVLGDEFHTTEDINGITAAATSTVLFSEAD